MKDFFKTSILDWFAFEDDEFILDENLLESFQKLGEVLISEQIMHPLD